MEGDTSKLIYNGIKTKKEIIQDKKSSNTLQKWLFRIGTFLMLFIGLMPIAFNLFLIKPGESLISILLITSPQNLRQSFESEISILRFGEIIVL